jgi:hypothetical protein
MMAEIEQYTEYGLKLPNGSVHWGQYGDRPIGTEAERSVMLLVLRKIAADVGFPEAEFLNRYQWVSRDITPRDTSFSIDDPDIAPVPGQIGIAES